MNQKFSYPLSFCCVALVYALFAAELGAISYQQSAISHQLLPCSKHTWLVMPRHEASLHGALMNAIRVKRFALLAYSIEHRSLLRRDGKGRSVIQLKGLEANS